MNLYSFFEILYFNSEEFPHLRGTLAIRDLPNKINFLNWKLSMKFMHYSQSSPYFILDDSKLVILLIFFLYLFSSF